MKHYFVVALALIVTPGTALAQTIPASIPEVINICSPVIDEEYKGVTTRNGTCVKATTDFLGGVYGPPTVPDPTTVTADLVVELAKLYRSALCPKFPTELPDAIRAAASASSDAGQQKQINTIAQTIADCQATQTGALGDTVPVIGRIQASPNR